jgi:putative MATE family efflux protein
VTYLRITFLGAPFTFCYNALAAGFKSVGDAKTPLKFLAFSSILNALLDLIFLRLLGFGILCSAATTVFAEAVSAGLAVWYMGKHTPELIPGKQQWRLDGAITKKLLLYGGPTALQQAIQPVCKVLIQGQVNALGVTAIAAYNAVTRVDDFACIPEQSISSAISTYIAQNRGAKKSERIRPGFRQGMTLEFCYWVFIGTAVMLLRAPIVSLFVTGEGADEVVRLGSGYLSWMALFYLWPAMTNGMQGFFRGMGKMYTTMLGTFIQASVRTVCVFLLAPVVGLNGIAFSCAIGWSLMLLFEVPYYVITCKKHRLYRENEVLL